MDNGQNIKIKINQSALDQLTKEQNDLLLKMAEAVKDKAISICPVKTGKLQDSIDILDRDWENKTMYIGTAGTNYGLFVEMGTSKMAAQPFMRPALDTVEAELI